jgi:ribose transport system permease protein
MYASRVASGNPTQGSGLRLSAITVVFLGMTMSEEVEPRVLATRFAVLILGVLDNDLTQMSVDSYARDILIGTIMVLAVAASSLSKLSLNRITRHVPLLQAPLYRLAFPTMDHDRQAR